VGPSKYVCRSVCLIFTGLLILHEWISVAKLVLNVHELGERGGIVPTRVRNLHYKEVSVPGPGGRYSTCITGGYFSYGFLNIYEQSSFVLCGYLNCTSGVTVSTGCSNDINGLSFFMWCTQLALQNIMQVLELNILGSY
jgi:hypothetical protein